jgi:hypothetical protein
MSAWDGIWGDVLSAGASFLGQQSTNAANAQMAFQSNAFNAQQAEANREFQANQRATQYQTAVKDMELAGLNPMLAYSQGGAGSSAGSTASAVSPARFESPAASAIHSAFESARTRKEQQDVRIKAPVETGAGMVDRGLKTISDSVKPISDSVAALVKKAEDLLTGSSISTAASATVEKVVDKAKDVAVSIGDVIGQSGPARAVSAAVNSATDAKDAVSAGVQSVKDAWAKGQAQGGAANARKDETPRERAARGEGGRLGTLGRRPMWAPQYGEGEH